MLTSVRNPFEVVMIIAGLLAGIVGLLPGGETSNTYGSNIYGLHGAILQVFHACLALGTGTVALSLLLRPPMTLLIERVGMIWLAALFLPYGVAMIFAVRFGLYPIGFLILGYGFACAARVLQITHDMRLYRRELRRIISDSP